MELVSTVALESLVFEGVSWVVKWLLSEDKIEPCHPKLIRQHWREGISTFVMRYVHCMRETLGVRSITTGRCVISLIPRTFEGGRNGLVQCNFNKIKSLPLQSLPRKVGSTNQISESLHT